MRMPRVRFTTRRLMVAVVIVAVACKVLSELAGLETFSWWFVSLLMTTFGVYLASAFACGLVLDRVVAPSFSTFTGWHERPRRDRLTA